MKFMHTADWHVGKTLKGRDRLDEQRAVLAEIAQVAEANQVDAVLVAGDVYESSAPSAQAQHLVVQTLLRLRQAGAEVLVIAGNHNGPPLELLFDKDSGLLLRQLRFSKSPLGLNPMQRIRWSESSPESDYHAAQDAAQHPTRSGQPKHPSGRRAVRASAGATENIPLKSVRSRDSSSPIFSGIPARPSGI